MCCTLEKVEIHFAPRGAFVVTFGVAKESQV